MLRLLLRLTLLAALPFLLGGCVPRTLVPETSRDLVVLVHGMGRSQFAMEPLARRLRGQGFRTLNVGYNSFTSDIDAITERLDDEIVQETERVPPPRVHFVSHSLGGIAVRQLLRTDRPERLGRVVMLAPPNQGSRSADRWTPWVGWLLRPISQLRTENSTVAEMPPPRGVEFAIIVGDADAKVSIAESQLEGASEHVVVESAHTFIMTKPSVARMTACFLRTGATGCGASGEEMGKGQ